MTAVRHGRVVLRAAILILGVYAPKAGANDGEAPTPTPPEQQPPEDAPDDDAPPENRPEEDGPDEDGPAEDATLAEAPAAEPPEAPRGPDAGARWRQPQDPYRWTDFTAYTLDRGELRLSPWAVQVGVAPWVHVGTRLPLLAVGIPNLHAKVDIQRGRVDLALQAEGAIAPATGPLTAVIAPLTFLEDLRNAYLVKLDATLSARLLDPWSLHLGLGWARGGALADVQLAELPTVDLAGTSLPPQLSPWASADALVVRLATDVRFNRRDSLVFMGAFVPTMAARVADDPKVRGLGVLRLGLAWLAPNAPQGSWTAAVA